MEDSTGPFLWQLLVTKFEFGASLVGDCDEIEVTSKLELSVTFGMNL
jgi:hypothetical protein